MSTQTLQNTANDIKNILADNLHLAKKRQCDLDKLVTKSDTLHKSADIFHRHAEKTKWQTWWNNNLKSIKLAFIVIGIIITFILLIGFIKIIF